MKVLLLEDVYKLGRAGDVKKVANGYGRNYLIPQGLAVLATPGALKQVEHIRVRAATQRAALNEEMSGVAEQLDDLVLTFSMKAGETDKLYGSVTTQMIADSLKENTGFELRVAPDASETPVPTQDIIDLIGKIDRDGVRLSEFH